MILFSAFKKTFSQKIYFLIFIASAVVAWLFFVWIEVKTIPGNDFAFQLSLFRIRDHILLGVFAILIGLNLTFQIYSFRQKKTVRTITKTLAHSTSSGALGIFGAVAGTAVCASCLASLFGLLGLGMGSVIFVLQYQTYFLTGAIMLMLCSLYFTARRINKTCLSCIQYN